MRRKWKRYAAARAGVLGLLLLAGGGWLLGEHCRRLAEFEPAGQAVLRPLVTGAQLQAEAQVGEVVDVWRGVVVRANGQPYDRSHGRHYAADGYYYGRMWQCVEFVKRFYYDHYGHVFPDGMGHAKSFFDPEVAHGGWNARRGLRQFVNGGGEAPRPGDLVVWTQGTYGHVAIVCRVEGDFVEVIQQNVREGSRWRLATDGNKTTRRFGGSDGPCGFLRRAE